MFLRGETRSGPVAYWYRGLDCEQYVVCFMGVGKLQRCVPGMHINTKTGDCSEYCTGIGQGNVTVYLQSCECLFEALACLPNG